MRLAPLPQALLLLCASPMLYAADGAAVLSTLSVTAKGYAADEAEIPVSAITIERDALLQRQAQNLGDAVRGQPGLSVAADSAHGQNPVIRGLRREGIVLMVDGIRVNSAQPQGAIASLMSLGLAERVEIVKGPSSVLYGTGGLGGAINLRLPQASFAPGVSFDATAGFDSASRGLRSSGVLNASTGDHAVMVGASVAGIGDYDAPGGRVPLSGYDSQALIGQYRLRIDAARQLRVSLQEQRDSDVWYPGSRKPHANAGMVGETIVHSPRQSRRLAEIGYALRGVGARPLNLDLRIYRQEVDRTVWSYAEGLQRDIGRTQVGFVTDGADLKADWAVHPRHLLSGGINLWRMEASPDRYLASPTPASPLMRNLPFENGRLDAIGVYLQDDFQPTERLGVLVGLRHDTIDGAAASVNNGSVRDGLARRDGANSGSLGVIYEAAPLLRPYANVSRGFRAGEMRERFEASPRGDGYHYLGNPQIRPEKAAQVEMGIKGTIGGLAYSVSVFRSRIDDFITGQPTGAVVGGLPVKQTVNLGEVVIRGVELGARWQFRKAQWVRVGYSRLRGENRDLDEPLFQMPADELSIGWDGQVAEGWTADAVLRLVGRQDRVAAVFSRGTENATAGFATLDLGASWRYGPRQSLRVALRNLADKAYHEHLTEGVSGREIRAPGRSLQVTWQGRF